MAGTPPIPKTMKALVTQANKTAAVKSIPVPEIAEDEILVQVAAVAQNPTDWKRTSTNLPRHCMPYLYHAIDIQRITIEGSICGCDWSGYVVKIGQGVSTLGIGDHVAGFVQGGTYTDRGAFAEYVKTAAELAWKVPAGTLSHEEAATMGCA